MRGILTLLDCRDGLMLSLVVDGKTVKFRMKCTICGKEDSSWKSISIPRGMARSSFFCPKCRKRQDCELQGVH